MRNCETCFQSPGRCRSCGILKVRADACDTGATKVRRNYEAVKIFNIDGQTPATQARQKFDEIVKLWKFSKSSGRRLRHRCDKNSRKFRNCEHLQHRWADACDTGATKVRRNCETVKIPKIAGQTPSTQVRQKFDEIAKL